VAREDIPVQTSQFSGLYARIPDNSALSAPQITEVVGLDGNVLLPQTMLQEARDRAVLGLFSALYSIAVLLLKARKTLLPCPPYKAPTRLSEPVD
jgi:hypothetical protein